MKSSICAAALAACVWATSARAGDSPLSLTWIVPPGCPTEAEVAADVTRRLAGSISARPVLARAEVTVHKDSWRVVLSTQQSGATGRRVLEGPTCAAVASATALILALTIDPQAAAQNASVPPPPPPRPPPPPPLLLQPLPLTPPLPLPAPAPAPAGRAR